ISETIIQTYSKCPYCDVRSSPGEIASGGCEGAPPFPVTIPQIEQSLSVAGQDTFRVDDRLCVDHRLPSGLRSSTDFVGNIPKMIQMLRDRYIRYLRDGYGWDQDDKWTAQRWSRPRRRCGCSRWSGSRCRCWGSCWSRGGYRGCGRSW